MTTSFDPSNKLLSLCPASLVTGYLETPEGRFMVVTVRTDSCSLTVFLNKEDATVWAASLKRAADNFSETLMTAAPAAFTPNGNRKAR